MPDSKPQRQSAIVSKSGRASHRIGVIAAAAFPCLVLWVPAILISIYVKWSLLVYEGFRTVSRLLGRIDVVGGARSRADLFSPLERLGFFRNDLLLVCILAPAVGGLVLCWVSGKWRLRIVAAASFLVIVFLYLQLHGFWMVGQFQSWGLWRDALRWGWMHPDDARQYTGVGMLVKLGGLLATISLATWGLSRWQRRFPTPPPVVRRCAIACCLGTLILTGLAWRAPGPFTGYHRSAVWMCTRALLDISDVDQLRYASLAEPQAMEKWRQVSHTPAPMASPPYFGAAQGFDVICFVMETAPARCLDVTSDMSQTPNMRTLRQHAWVGANHVSTYPYTRRAIFSLMTGWYPTATESFDAECRGKHTSGLMHSLGERGYVTAAYKPYADSADDEDLQRSEGLSTAFYGEAKTGGNAEGHETQAWRQRVVNDRAALQKMKADIASWIAKDQRYAVLYLPQIGHAPWPDMSQDGTQGDVISRGRAVIALQDQWLGELLTVLESAGRLQRTIILVTGDHGVRTRREDPAFEGGLVSPYSFEVPFLLYVPQVLSQAEVIPWMTSHIDLTPSVLDLIGIRQGRQLEMGAPLWDPRLRQRTVYFWAGVYLGADGFYDTRKYAMWQRVSDTTSLSNEFNFVNKPPLSRDSPDSRYVMEQIADGLALTHRITHLGSR